MLKTNEGLRETSVDCYWEMDRYNELKLALKKWETSFFEINRRKPTKVDVACASEETQKLYREYRAIKQNRERQTTENNQSAQVDSGSKSLMKTVQNEEASECDIWGLHLNRQNRKFQELAPKEHSAPKASAQYYGMKLKEKLRTTGQERPISLRKLLTSRRTQLSKENNDGENGPVVRAHSATLKSAQDLQPAPQDSPNGSDQLQFLHPAMKDISPSKVLRTQTRTPQTVNKLQQLQQCVSRRLSSIDLGWLDRCQEITQPDVRLPILGRPSLLANGKYGFNSDHGKLPSFGDSTSQTDHKPQNLNDTVQVVSEQSLHQSDFPTVNKGSCSVSASSPSADDTPSSLGNVSLKVKYDDLSVSSSDFWDSEKPAELGNGYFQDDHTCQKDIGTGTVQIVARTRLEHQIHTNSVTSKKRNCKTQESSQEDCDGVEIATDCEHSQELNAGKGSQDLKTSSKKRQRTFAADAMSADACEDLEGNAKKRRKATKPSNTVTAQKRKKRILRASCKSVADDNSPDANADEWKPKPELPKENLYGDLEEGNLCSEGQKSSVVRVTQPKKDGNFVRINLKKKSHVRGGVLRGASLRRQVWKQKWNLKGEHFGGGAGRFSRKGDMCFRCGATGHWAKNCSGQGFNTGFKAASEEKVEMSEMTDDDIAPLPTLEEVARLTSMHNTVRGTLAADNARAQLEPTTAAEFQLNTACPTFEKPKAPPAVEPLYGLAEDGKVIATPAEVFEALSELGFHSFRPGQELTVMRILSGLSTLVVLSTGMGKSFCYQLPAYLYAKRSKCITLVISPLVSLMDDQVSGLPSKLKAVCIHSSMTRTQREAAVAKVKEGKVHVLLLSPEALVGGGRAGSSCLPPARELPPVAFACIDEAHCVSEWSHNFRPCYLRLCKVLKERLGVKCLLGLTATATLVTARNIAHHLGIQEQEGIAVRSADVPANLFLSVSTDRDRDQALVTLIQGDRFASLDSIIVYCTRREETTRIAALLRTCLQGVTLREMPQEQTVEGEMAEEVLAKRKKAMAKKKLRRPLKWIADCYHAGMSASERRRIQNNFMSGQLRIVVATVAFGMGLDKSDVRGIIHYNMPKGFENYVQEIGRAGRDGKPAHCHLFLDPDGGDLNELRRYIYADTVDYYTVKKLVQKVFPPCKCRQIYQKQQDVSCWAITDNELLEIPDPSEELPIEGEQPPEGDQSLEEFDVNSSRVCHRHERAMSIQKTVEMLDIREEGIETLLCYLELHPQHWVELMHPTFSTCRLQCYSGPMQLRNIARRCPPVAVALAKERLCGVEHTHSNSVEFDVVEMADSMGWELLPVKRELRQLQWTTSQPKQGFQGTGKNGVLVEFSNLSFHFRSYGDLDSEELDAVCKFLHQRVLAHERTALCHLRACFKSFHSVAFKNCSICADAVSVEKSSRLKQVLKEYFDQKNDQTQSVNYSEDEDELSRAKLKDWESQIRADVRQFLSIHHEEKFSGRAIARIFHGIESPCHPAQVYGRDRRFWRKYLNFDFNEIIRMATEELIRMK
ncbi:ATP-dependent DNA helicase Q4 isoform X2 [Stegostoma tigrinum]|uniref:ATP-dependent DNA helicase Q4 isoform X2 n=1 Tax=Stegostoma tigrinum TaxID=3053191 RepID=UPI00286FD140|nr:ATP-dependent DNA helicase Q4 isoform X2 [Stegostoma tigrinum]